MTETKTFSVDEAASAFTSLIGEYAWWVRCSDHRVLQMEFGDPHLRVQGPWTEAEWTNERTRSATSRRLVLPTGRWSLFVENGSWSVGALGLACSRSTSSQEEVDLCLSRLEGQRLTSARVAEEDASLVLGFDLDGMLYIAQALHKADDDEWTLYQSQGPSISFLSSGVIQAEFSEKPI